MYALQPGFWLGLFLLCRSNAKPLPYGYKHISNPLPFSWFSPFPIGLSPSFCNSHLCGTQVCQLLFLLGKHPGGLVFAVLKNRVLPNKQFRLCVHPKHRTNPLCPIPLSDQCFAHTNHGHLSNRILRQVLYLPLSSVKPFVALSQKHVPTQGCQL